MKWWKNARFAAAFLATASAVPAGEAASDAPAEEERALEEKRKEGSEAVKLVKNADQLYQRSRFAEAEPLYFQAAEILVRRYDAGNRYAQRALWGLARSLSGQGKHDMAASIYRKELARIKAPDASKDFETRFLWGRLAESLDAHGKYAEAEAEYRELLAAIEQAKEEHDLITMEIRDKVAGSLRAQGQLAEAEAEYRALVAMRTHLWGAETTKTLDSRNDLAGALADQGKYAEAEVEYRAVVALRERMLGAQNPDTLESRNNLAGVLADQGKHAEAEAGYLTVLASRELLRGAGHADAAQTCYDLASCMEAQAVKTGDASKKAESLAFARRALAIWERNPREKRFHTPLAQALVRRLEKP